jgi:DNA-binding beta-propeller fold protein YncE
VARGRPREGLHRQRAAQPRDRARRKALYVVNYESGTVTKLRTGDMSTLQTIDACFRPMGITYDRPTQRVWVACYTGSIRVYDDDR